MPRNIKFMSLFFAASLASWAQVVHPASAPAGIVITLGHYYGGTAPTLTRDDLIVTQYAEPLAITNLVPLRAGLELFVIVDNCSNCEPGSKFEELRRFIEAQPSTTAVGIASIGGGRLKVLQDPTADHARAVKALETPTGSNPSSPFRAITELISGWHSAASRRAVLLISNGIDPAATQLYQSESAEKALAAAQRAGVTVYAMYHPSADYLSGDFSKLYSGQVLLAHLANETGGEAYFVGFGPLPSLSPMLADVSDHLQNQYLVQFAANPEKGSGALEEITVKCKLPNVDLMAPNKVWIPGLSAGSSGR